MIVWTNDLFSRCFTNDWSDLNRSWLFSMQRLLDDHSRIVQYDKRPVLQAWCLFCKPVFKPLSEYTYIFVTRI